MSAPKFTVEPSRTPGDYLVFQDGALLMVTNNAALARVIESHAEACAALEEAYALMPLGTGKRAEWMDRARAALAKARGEG